MQRNRAILTDVLNLHMHELFVFVNVGVTPVNVRHRQQHESVEVTVHNVHSDPMMPRGMGEDNDVVDRAGVTGRRRGVSEGRSRRGGDMDQEGRMNHRHGVTPSLLPSNYRHVVGGAFVVTLVNGQGLHELNSS